MNVILVSGILVQKLGIPNLDLGVGLEASQVNKAVVMGMWMGLRSIDRHAERAKCWGLMYSGTYRYF